MTASQRRRIEQVLRLSPVSLDDEELSARTGIAPRQVLNIVCRGMERDGVIRRSIGPDGRYLNQLPDRDTHAAMPVPEIALQEVDSGRDTVVRARASVDLLPAGVSPEQRTAERAMLDVLGERLDVRLDPTRLTTSSGLDVEVDGVDLDRRVLVECWAHQGPPKGVQRQKILTDALKLTWIAAAMRPRPQQIILCMSDPEAAAPFQPVAGSWSSQALSDLGITVEVVELPIDLRATARSAKA
jgi:hypothetical protein